MVKHSDEFENGCIPMLCGAMLTIQRLCCSCFGHFKHFCQGLGCGAYF